MTLPKTLGPNKESPCRNNPYVIRLLFAINVMTRLFAATRNVLSALFVTTRPTLAVLELYTYTLYPVWGLDLSRHSKSNVRKSNSIELNPWIEFDWVRQSNEIEHHTLPRFLRNNNICIILSFNNYFYFLFLYKYRILFYFKCLYILAYNIY